MIGASVRESGTLSAGAELRGAWTKLVLWGTEEGLRQGIVRPGDPRLGSGASSDRGGLGVGAGPSQAHDGGVRRNLNAVLAMGLAIVQPPID